MAAVEYSERAEEWLEKSDKTTRAQVLGKIDEARDFPGHFLKRLSGSPLYTLRAGNYRIIIDWRKNEDLLFIRRISKRDGAYQK